MNNMIKSNKDIFLDGIIKDNPVFTIMLGLCPVLAVSTMVINGIGMGVAATFVLLGSNIVISLLRNFIPDKVRIPSYIIIIASFVTIIDLIMKAYVPPLSRSLGIFVPLIVVNCIILGRAEAFANKNSVTHSIIDAFGMGIGFMFSLTLIAFIRELLGAGSLTVEMEGIGGFTLKIPSEFFTPASIMILPAGAFLVMGLLMGLFNYIRIRSMKE